MREYGPLLAIVCVILSGGCLSRSPARPEPGATPSLQELRVRAAAAEAVVHGTSNRIDLAARALENVVALRTDAESAFLAVLAERDLPGLELAIKNTELSQSDVADAFGLALRLVRGGRRISEAGVQLKLARHDLDKGAPITSQKEAQERLLRCVVDVETFAREMDAVAEEIKVRWLLRQGPSEGFSNRSIPSGSGAVLAVERGGAGEAAQTAGE